MKAIPLSLAFEVASGIAFAQGAGDPMAHLRACSLMEHAERLECLEKLSRNIAAAGSPGAGRRQLDRQRDHLAGKLYADRDRHRVVSRRLRWLLDAARHLLPRRPHRTGGRRTGRLPQRRGLHHFLPRQ